MEPQKNPVRDATTAPGSGAARAMFLVESAALCSHLVFALAGVPCPTACGPRQIQADLRWILCVAQAIYTDTGEWPESIEDLVNAKTPGGKPAIASLEKLPRDPWGNKYGYELVGGLARVTCLGSDHAPGGEGEAEDVTYPEVSP